MEEEPPAEETEIIISKDLKTNAPAFIGLDPFICIGILLF